MFFCVLRHTEKHPEVIACLDAMEEARWVVYRTQGLSLGATRNLSMGDQNVEDSLLQIAPGRRSSSFLICACFLCWHVLKPGNIVDFLQDFTTRKSGLP